MIRAAMWRATRPPLAAALLCAAAVAPAQPPAPLPVPRPGAFVWNDAAAPAGDVAVIVDRVRQVAAVYRGGAPIAIAAISTGRAGHATPAGEFTILEKDAAHRSSIYGDAPMPYMQRLTWDGIAIHAGRDPGHPASHGCIRVPTGFARRLFAATRLGATVRIGDAALPGRWLAAAPPAAPPHPGWLEQSQPDYVSWGGG